MGPADAALALLSSLMALGPAYVLVLAAASRRRAVPPPVPDGRLPSLDVVVAMRDEAAIVADKVREVAALDYPADRLRAWFVDGGSTDGTADLAEAAADGDARIRVLRTPAGDKTAQVNEALARAQGEWVLVTDADARFGPGTLRAMVAEALGTPGVLVVGAEVRPAAAHILERLHWEVANALRRFESRLGSASMVTAPAYLFRRSAVAFLPADVVADDIHVALAGSAAGGRVHIAEPVVTELRAPRDVGALLSHKQRKTDAYLREVFRFLPRTSGMRPWARTIFLWRSAHILLFPFLLAACAVVMGRWLAGSAPAAAWAAMVGGLGVLSACILLGTSRGLRAAAGLPALVAVLSGVILAAVFRYPFRRQTAAYPKVGPAHAYRDGPSR